jgi:RNA:NAD 2'-phosphotransferase (TPT1/KptA family)
MIVYHGTTAECLKSIKLSGLRKGTYVSPSLFVSLYFAKERSYWNKQERVVLEIEIDKKFLSDIIKDRSGRLEAKTLKVEYQWRII